MIRSLLLSASAGAIVDRVDYFRLLRLTQLFTLCYAVAVAALSFAGLIGIGLLFFLTLARGVMLSCGCGGHRCGENRGEVIGRAPGQDLHDAQAADDHSGPAAVVDPGEDCHLGRPNCIFS